MAELHNKTVKHYFMNLSEYSDVNISSSRLFTQKKETKLDGLPRTKEVENFTLLISNCAVFVCKV